jgi:LPS sulfotransferase NodH/GT2 family glycosyltransferase
LVAQETPRQVEIIVVDNHPASGVTPPVVAEFPEVVLVEEPRRGLAYARNAGFAASRGHISIATDDDVRMAPGWLEKLVAPFSRNDVMIVTGNVLPLELETGAQRQFERYGGLGRGFDACEADGAWFRKFRHRAVPTWELGATANAAFRTAIFHHPDIGLMDEALGPGMPSGVGEDTYLFYRVLKAGFTIRYEPEAYVWHKHRREQRALRRQIYEYSKGHVAYHLTTLLRDSDMRAVPHLLLHLPIWRIKQIRRKIKDGIRRRRSKYTWSLIWLEIVGNLLGPWALWRSRRRVKREGRSQPAVHSRLLSPLPAGGVALDGGTASNGHSTPADNGQDLIASSGDLPVIPPAEGVRKFVVLFDGRAGSTYLMECLRSHPKIRTKGEELVRLREKGFGAQAEWIRSFFETPSKAHIRAVGFKTKLRDVTDPEEFAKLLKALNVSVIHLERRNVVKQTVSLLNAVRLYETTKDWNLYAEADRLPPLEIDLVKFADWLSQVEREALRIGRFVEKLPVPTLHLAYEDLLLDSEGTLTRALEFLGVPLEAVHARVMKNTSDDLRQAVSNFVKLRAQYAGTEYERMFDEVLVPASLEQDESTAALVPSGQITRFVVLCVGRSGSTHLVEGLRSHSQIMAWLEPLVPLKEQGWGAQARWIRKFYSEQRPLPCAAVGFKAKLSDVDNVDQFANLLQSLDVRIIHLERQNVVKQAISWLNSQRLHEESGNWNLYGDADRLPPLDVDPTKFAEYIHLLEQGKRQLRRYSANSSQPTLRIYYEDLLLEFDETMERVLEFLELPVEAVDSQVKKSTSDDLRRAISDFAKVRAPYEGTIYEPMFDEILVSDKPTGEGRSSIGGLGSSVQEKAYERFVIVGQERTGSNLLLDLLASHESVVALGEIFNPSREVRKRVAPGRTAERGDDPIEYLERCVFEDYPGRVEAVGFKLFYTHARNGKWKVLWDHLRHSKVAVIHVRRANLLDRYLSHQLALGSDEWVVLEGEARSLLQPIHLDPRDCFRSFQRSVWHQEKVDDLFKHNPKIEVIYEELADDMTVESTRVQEFLGLEIQQLSTRTRKQRTAKKPDIIANYDALRDELLRWTAKGWAREEWLDFFDGQ